MKTRPLSELEKRILEISHKYKLSHISSCLTAVDLIDNIYKNKKEKDIFILSSGHAALALYVVLEKYYFKDAEMLFKKHGVHPNRDLENHIYASSGSLGSAIMIGVGAAVADKTRDVYVMLSDGECAEGSVWEALRVAGEWRLENLRIVVNANGSGAYGRIDVELLDERLNMFFPSLVVRTQLLDFPDYLQSYHGHYKVLNDEEYKEITS
jgi:transketolase